MGQPFTSFPTSTTYSTLPTVSFVIPNLNDDMHNPTIFTAPTTYSVTAISNGDTWVQNNLTNYINWAKTNNSLLILTFDEDDGGVPNQITTMFIGQMVQGGSYNNSINHYAVLRTIEDMYNLPYCDSSAYASPITNIWKSVTTNISQNIPLNNSLNIWPIPAKENLNISYNASSSDKGFISIYDLTGRLIKQEDVLIKNGENNYTLNIRDVTKGIYLIRFSNSIENVCKKIVVE